MLPDADGLEILARLRRTPGLKNVPVMMLTAKDTELDTVRALDGGADDYLSKPFGMMEVVSRTRALLRRAGREHAAAEKPVSLMCGDVTLWPDRREVSVGGREVQLTMREFDLLEFLMRSPGVVFSRETLLQRVWGLGLRRRVAHRGRARSAGPRQARGQLRPDRDRTRRGVSRPRLDGRQRGQTAGGPRARSRTACSSRSSWLCTSVAVVVTVVASLIYQSAFLADEHTQLAGECRTIASLLNLADDGPGRPLRARPRRHPRHADRPRRHRHLRQPGAGRRAAQPRRPPPRWPTRSPRARDPPSARATRPAT